MYKQEEEGIRGKHLVGYRELWSLGIGGFALIHQYFKDARIQNY